jgi:hypothetical protein
MTRPTQMDAEHMGITSCQQSSGEYIRVECARTRGNWGGAVSTSEYTKVHVRSNPSTGCILRDFNPVRPSVLIFRCSREWPPDRNPEI